MLSSADPRSSVQSRPDEALKARLAGTAHPAGGDAWLDGLVPQQLPERPVRPRGSALARGVLRLFGWRLVFDGLPARQGVIAVYPHTSNWDFVWGLLAKWGMGLPLSFWAKHSLFGLPLFGRFLRRVGGLAIDRRAPRGVVGQTVDRLRAAGRDDAFLWIAIAPEGTRSPVEGWRSGFYHLATQSDVPLALAFIDYRRREVGLDSFWRASGDAARDMACFARRLDGRVGRRPQNAAPVRLV